MSSEPAKYYLDHKDEFFMEYGHETLVKKLKPCLPHMGDKPILSLDLGSNVGNYFETIHKLCPERNHTVLAFEPNPINLPMLETNAKKYNNVIVYNQAVSNTPGILPFHNYSTRHENMPGNTIAALRGGGAFISNVNVTTVDAVLQPFPNHLVKFVKIDTEGNDTNVIRGMQKNLHRTCYIIFECSDCLDDHRGPNEVDPMRKVVEFLDTHNFNTYRIGTKRLIQVNGNGWDPVYEQVKYHSNCFAIKKNDPCITDLIDANGFYK